MRSIINIYSVLVFISIIFISCSNKKMKETKEKTIPAIDLADLDTTVSPFDDFYQYATGGWQKNNPLPNEESRFGSFDLLAKNTSEKINAIINGLAEQKNPAGSVEDKIASFYKMGMDTVKIENDKFASLEPVFNEIDAMKDKNELPVMISKLQKKGAYPFFAIFGESDANDANMKILWIWQAGLGLSNRDYYTDQDDHSAEIRAKYKEFMSKMFTFANFADVEKNVAKVYAIEEELAKNSKTNLELRDPYASNNMMTIPEIQKITSNFNFSQYLSNIGLEKLEKANLAQPKFFTAFNKIIADNDLETIKIYLKWNLLNSAADYLHKDIVDANFDFYGKFLSGQQEQKPRWRKIVSVTNGCLGEALGQIFVKEYFPPESKQRMETLVKNLQSAFAERIKNNSWMCNETKEKAINKLNSMIVKIGYPEKWRDYSKLDIKNDYFFSNVMRSNEFDFQKMISEIGKPVDKTEWGMTPQTVNAYYNPTTNEICFPAAILQPPFFYADADDAVNYGAIGVVIGHEMTHGFDDQGRNYDIDGNLNDWWTKEDGEKFAERTKILVERYNNFIVVDSLHADGELTLGENIADLGGLKISFDAFKAAQKTEKQETADKIDGFTPEQRFYLSYAKIWGQNIREEEIRSRLKNDVHSLGEWRVNGQLPGIEDFIKAFNVPENSPMRLPKEKWADIW